MSSWSIEITTSFLLSDFKGKEGNPPSPDVEKGKPDEVKCNALFLSASSTVDGVQARVTSDMECS